MSEQLHIPSGRPAGVFTRVAQAVPHLRFVGPPVEIDRSKKGAVVISDGHPLPPWAKCTLWVLSQAVVDWGAPVWECHLSASEVGELGSLGRTTVKRAMKVLIASGYIDRYVLPGGNKAVTIIHHEVITHRAAAWRNQVRPESTWDPSTSVKREVDRVGPPRRTESDPLAGPSRTHPRTESDPPPDRVGPAGAPYLLDRSYTVTTDTPPPPGGGEGGTKGQDSGGLSRREVVEAWNDHSAKPMGVARISDRMAIPDLLLDVPAEMARAAVDAYFEHAPQRTHDWEPLPLSWTKFVKWVEAILQWLADPSLDEPGMGREYSEARRSGRRSVPARPRLALVEPAGAPQEPQSWAHMAAWVRPVLQKMEANGGIPLDFWEKLNRQHGEVPSWVPAELREAWGELPTKAEEGVYGS